MRPKKQILILGVDNDSRSILQFTLETWGYLAIPAENLTEAKAFVEQTQTDLIIASPDFVGVKEALADLHLCRPYIPQLILAPGRDKLPLGMIADATMLGKFSQEEVRARVKVLSARKRGPRVGLRKPVQSEVPPLSVQDRRFA